ncbi:inactive ubiquitin carboxyl-terminal hydrolase MINDY-4B-like [Oratosquilla oratoria]|uniref:inactive ubiquitin carboxyl-terminal hydrolase MINDY-4B-like n=1 Tax=Oratosquilla oratoria TaxID=337810 RepID=UPI003F765AB0
MPDSAWTYEKNNNTSSRANRMAHSLATVVSAALTPPWDLRGGTGLPLGNRQGQTVDEMVLWRGVRRARLRRRRPSLPLDVRAPFFVSPPKVIGERVLYSSRGKTTAQKVPLLGGTPISLDTAVNLRTALFGDAETRPMSLEAWTGLPFGFCEAETADAYRLSITKEATKGVLMCVQGYVLKHLLFSRRGPKASGDPEGLLRATAWNQEEALVGALSDILWKVGERQQAVLCLPQQTSHIVEAPGYAMDGCTEKIHTFEYNKQEDLACSIKKYLFEFLSGTENGVLLFLYSVLLSRGLDRIEEDRHGDVTPLTTSTGAALPCVLTLLLTGRATPFLHNGIRYDDMGMGRPQTGILTRAEIGLLVWGRVETSRNGEVVVNQEVGSRLKTPSLPVWITRCDDVYGILFNPKRDLTRDYHAEKKFDLRYISSGGSPDTRSKGGGDASQDIGSHTLLSVDTRTSITGRATNSNQRPPLESLLMTKWQDAEVNWNGRTPHV